MPRLEIGINQSIGSNLPKDLVHDRVWFGTSLSSSEEEVIKAIIERKRLSQTLQPVGVAIASAIILANNTNLLKQYSSTVNSLDMYLGLGLGDFERLKKLEMFPSSPSQKLIYSLDSIIQSLPKDKVLVGSMSSKVLKWSSDQGFGVVLNTSSPVEVKKITEGYSFNKIMVYAPLLLKDLPPRSFKKYNGWVKRMVGKRDRTQIELTTNNLKNRLLDLNQLNVDGIILSAPWLDSDEWKVVNDILSNFREGV